MTTTYVQQVLTLKVDEPNSFFTFICSRSDGHYMVINGGTNRILVYNQGGKLIHTNFGNRLLNKRLTTPSLITELLDKNLAVFDKCSKQIKKISRQEDHIATFEIGMETYSLNVNHYGHMVMAHIADRNKRIVSIRDSASGHVLHFLEIPTHPHSLPGAPFYAIYHLPSNIITLDQSSCSITFHTIDGAVQYSVGKQGFVQGNLHSPSSMCVDTKGNLVVADTRNDRIVRYKSDNMKVSDTLVADIPRPLCVAFDKQDHLLVLMAKNILIYDYDIQRPPSTYPVPALIDGLL